MAKGPRTWRCNKQQGGVPCHHVNPKRKQICERCGKKTLPPKKKAHEVHLDLTYEEFVILNGGEYCGICGAPRSDRRLDRDHSHIGAGFPRGLLCHSCNRTLSRRMEISAKGDLAGWLRKAADYVERAERRKGIIPKAFL